MERIGIFGGSFDPPHLGHVRLARFLIGRLSLDRLLIVPAACSPFKTEVHADDGQRLSMCRTAFSMPEAEICDYELCRGGKSYTVDTLAYLREKYPEAKLYLAVGEDQLTSFHLWYRWQDILGMATLCAVCRTRETASAALEAYADRMLRPVGEALVLPFDPLPVSSTEIRRRIGAGEPAADLLDPGTAAYISDHGLYGAFNGYRKAIRALLSDYRYVHSLAVADAAMMLAHRYGGDEAAAYAAGLLHDVLKEQPREAALAFFEENGVSLTPLERESPKLWHAMAGAVYVKKQFGASDAVAGAIRWHTTGRAGMTLMEKILFVADFISADRDYPGVEEMRRRAAFSLESAMEEGLRFTIAELEKQGRPVHPDSLACYEEILKGKEKE